MKVNDLKQFRREMEAIAAVIDEPDSTPSALMRAHKGNSSEKWNPEEDTRRGDENAESFLNDVDAAVVLMKDSKP